MKNSELDNSELRADPAGALGEAHECGDEAAAGRREVLAWTPRVELFGDASTKNSSTF